VYDFFHFQPLKLNSMGDRILASWLAGLYFRFAAQPDIFDMLNKGIVIWITDLQCEYLKRWYK
jgi:hypothetical protein